MGLAPGRPAKRVHCERCASGELWGGAKSSGYQGILSTGGDLPFRMCLQCCFGDRSMASFDLSILISSP